jgi:glycosyltransferase involved in cell wall biosynthesis
LAKDYRVTVYCGSYAGSTGSRVRDGVRYVFLPVGWAGPRGGQLLFQLLLPMVAVMRRPDLWIESLTPPFSTSLLPLISPAPVIGLVQMLSAADMARKYRLPFTIIERWGLRLYRHFIVLNETDRAAIRRWSRWATCELIPNGATRPPVAERSLGSGSHILFLGRIDVRQKGLDLLVAAIAADPPALPLVIAGGGTARDERRLRELVRPVRQYIRLVGRVCGPEKEKLLRDCAFVVLPSRYETFSLAALEGMTYGKPVVCFDLPQLEWISADAAVRVPPYDVQALGAAIGALSRQPERRRALGRHAYALSRHYDWDAIGERYRSLVSAMLDGRGQGRGE